MKNQNPSQTIVNETHLAMRVSVISVIVNLVLSAFKLLAGIFANSGAMISDAVHSASDVFSTFIVMIGVTISGKKADKEHPYGHERMECVAAIVLAVILFATGLGIGWSGIQKIFFMNSDSLEVPGMLALIAALVSIVTKEWMYWFTKFTADKIRSDALRADAWHHRSDALSSIGALIGIGGARLGFPVLDPIASVVICLVHSESCHRRIPRCRPTRWSTNPVTKRPWRKCARSSANRMACWASAACRPECLAPASMWMPRLKQTAA